MAAVGKQPSPTRRRPVKNAPPFPGVNRAGSELFSTIVNFADIAAVAAQDKWPSTERYTESLMKLIESIIVEGRQSGSSERKRLDEVTYAIYMVMCPFINPVQFAI